MGNSFLDTPITVKHTSWSENKSLKHSTCQMQGWRKYMEDAFIAQHSLPNHPDVAMYAVFDGHGGGEVARYCAAHFVDLFEKRKTLAEGNIGQALKETFVQIEMLLKMPPAIQEQIKNKEDITKMKATSEELEAGATAVVVVITNNKIFCANAGDSRATLCRKDSVFALSYDHNPENPIEKDRIEKSGVPIVQGRVNGLNLTRSIGDFKCKNVVGIPFNKQPIICVPDVIETDRLPTDKFILVGCDGIWEKFGLDYTELTEYFRKQLKEKNSLQCLKAYFDSNISKKESMGPYGRDNMTGIIVQFKN